MQMASEFILKSLTGVSDDKKQMLDLPFTVSPLPFLLFLLTQKDIYQMTGRDGGREGEKIKQLSCELSSERRLAVT